MQYTTRSKSHHWQKPLLLEFSSSVCKQVDKFSILRSMYKYSQQSLRNYSLISARNSWTKRNRDNWITRVNGHYSMVSIWFYTFITELWCRRSGVNVVRPRYDLSYTIVNSANIHDNYITTRLRHFYRLKAEAEAKASDNNPSCSHIVTKRL